MSREPFDNLEQLARRAVTCKRWRWMPGMRCNRGAVWFRIVDGYTIETPSLDTLPDFTDPATLGCLLHLVREAWDDDNMHIECRMHLDDVDSHASWTVRLANVNPRPLWRVIRCTGQTSLYWFNFEAEALVAALEAAP